MSKQTTCSFKEQGLETMRSFAKQGVYPGYPTARLVLPAGEIDFKDLPQGEWSCDEYNPSAEVHPWAADMIVDPSIGVVTGKGVYWNFGPNYTADSIVVRYEQGVEVLLIQRKDTGEWALPGGFIDKNETALETAVREVNEETSLQIGRIAANAELVYDGPVADKRTTLHAWPHTSAYRFDIFNESYVPATELAAGDDAKDVGWIALHHIRNGIQLFGSHLQLINAAFHDAY